MKMKKIIALVFVAVLCVSAAFAQFVPQVEATEYAARLFRSVGKTPARTAHPELRDGDTLYYVFTAADGSSVVVSADRRTQPLLAFTDGQPLAGPDVAPPAQMWLDHYANQLAELRRLPFRAEDAHPAWTRSRSGELRQEAAIAPFLRSNWGQGSQYNYYCPKDIKGEGGRTVTGCVATAMAQLMYHFRFPETGTGSYSYTDEHYGVQSADYGNTTYDFSAMCDKATSVNTAISTLMYHCGVGVDMVYGPDGSGMYNHSAANVLKTYFKFSPDTRYEFRDSTALDWDSLIVSHLERGIPLYYAGWSVPDTDGHAFICDGYQMVDSSFYYHFNFGWDGQSNGYFYTNHLNVGGSHFNLAQELIINAYPDTVQYEYPVPQPLSGTTTLTSRDGSFFIRDGNTASMDYTWVIRPEVDYLNRITLSVSARLGEADTLFITTDAPDVAPMVIAGDTRHSWDFSGTEITVRFVGGDSTEREVSVCYTSSARVFCSDIQQTTAVSGTITDGSGELDYNSLSYCGFYVKVTGAPATKLTFHEFELEEGHDSLHIYKYQNLTYTYLTSLTGHIDAGTEMVFSTNKILFIFESDEQNTAAGFTFDFAGTTETGVQEQEALDVSVWPNPSTSMVYVSIGEECASSIVTMQLCDIFGRKLAEKSAIRADETISFDVSGFAKGIYLLRIVTKAGKTVTRKIVRQ